MAANGSSFNYRFERFLLQPRERRLSQDGHDVSLGPRAFDLLVALVENRGHLVLKDELLSIVWPRVIVEENALQAQVSALRRVIGRSAIVTVSSRGYRFLPGVTREDPPSAALPGAARSNLPQSLTSFIGREKELVELSQLLRHNRLLTLTGAGGCGKSRLALQLAAAMQSMFPGGVWLVELAAIDDASLVPQALAGVLGIKESSALPFLHVLADHLDGRGSLLVLDNAEHVLDACVDMIDGLLKRTAATSVLVTSRESLHLTGAVTYRVPSLSFPDAASDVSSSQGVMQFEAVRLFADRARLQRPDFSVTDRNAPVLASLCRQIDGMPLAIELAAARLRAMSLEEIDIGLLKRFSLLSDGSRTALPRHRTLRSLIDWSHDLLGAAEKDLMSRVAVFADGWDLSSAEGICTLGGPGPDSMLDLLTSLVDKSLVTAADMDGTTRYRLLETVRQYGLDRLRERGEEAIWRQRHLLYFVALGEQAAPQLKSGDQRTWLARLQVDHDNLRAALSWSLASGEISCGLRLSASLWRFWWMRGHVNEGRDVLKRLLSSASQGVDAAVRGAALIAAGKLAGFQGDYAAARILQEEALVVHRSREDAGSVADSLDSLGTTLQAQGDDLGARALREEALSIYRQLDMPWEIAALLNNLGYSAREREDLVEAKSLLEESLAIRRTLDHTWGIATTVLNLAAVARAGGDCTTAQQLGEESLVIYRQLGEKRGLAYGLGTLANVACDMANWSLARQRMRECLSILVELNDRSGIAMALDILAHATMNDHPERASCVWGAAERMRHAIGFPRKAAAQAACEMQVASARQAMNDDVAFDRAWQTGATMDLQQVARFAIDDPDAI